MANENKLEEIIRASLENIRNMVDANTIIGNPINTASGVTIIPVSKITVGFATGGLDYSGKNDAAGNKQNFGGGGGTGLNIIPIGFLVVGKDGDVELLNVGMKAPSDPVEQLSDIVDRAPEILARIKAVFQKAPAEDAEPAEQK